MRQIIFGLTGTIASGKQLLADQLKDLGFDVYSLSDMVREEVRSRGLKLERSTLQDVGNDLRKSYGSQVLAERILLRVTDPAANIVFDSIRNPAEILYLQSILNIKIIGLDAPIEKRRAWYIKRSKERGEDSPDMSAFIKANLRDAGINEESHGQQTQKCLEKADVRFYNDGTKEELVKEFALYLNDLVSKDKEGKFAHKEFDR